MAKVVIYQEDQTFPVQSQLPLDPHPPFRILTEDVYSTYPDRFYGSARRYLDSWSVKFVNMENEYLRMSICPALGGRVWQVYDKINKRDVFYNSSEQLRPYCGGFGRGYVGGGIEMNYPFAHSVTNMRPREFWFTSNEDGSATVTIGEWERANRTRWAYAFTLRPGEARFELNVHIENPNPWETRYHYWCNAGVYIEEDSIFIYPETKAATHGDKPRLFSWPYYGGQRIDRLGNIHEPIGLYYDDTVAGYMGVWYPKTDYGVVHYSDKNVLPGKKFWSWGWSYWAHEYARKHSSKNATYGEIQSGRIIVQEHYDRFLPYDCFQWTEYWYPITGIGRFNAASENGAARFQIEGTHAGLNVCSNRNLGCCTAEFVVNGKVLDSLKLKLNTMESQYIETNLNITPEKAQDVSCRIRDEKDEVLLSVTALSERPKCHDIWFDIEHPEDRMLTSSVYWKEGEDYLRFNRILSARKSFEKALELDTNYHPAHISLGVLLIEFGEYDKAIEHIDAARKIAADDPKALYYRGLLLYLMGNDKKAEWALHYSLRFGYRHQSLTLLALIYCKRGDWNKAVEYIRQAWENCDSQNAKVQGLVAAIERTASNVHTVPLKVVIDTHNPLLLAEKMLAGDESAGITLREQLAKFPETLVEVSTTYLDCGLFENAEKLLGLIADHGSIDLFYKGYVEGQLGKDFTSTLQKAGNNNVDWAYAWRNHDHEVLQWALRVQPDNPMANFQMGNYLAGKSNLKSALELWYKAYAGMPEGLKFICSGNIYRSLIHLGKSDEAMPWLTKLSKDAKAEPHTLAIEAQALTKEGDMAKVDEMVSKYIDEKPDLIGVWPAILSFYIQKDEFERAEKLFTKIDGTQVNLDQFSSLWSEYKTKKALRLMAQEKWRAAAEILDVDKEVPANLGGWNTSFAHPRMLFHRGRCFEAMGDGETARRDWQRGVKMHFWAEMYPSFRGAVWQTKYYQALCLQKLGCHEEAETYFMGMYSAAQDPQLPSCVRGQLLEMVHWGRSAPEELKDGGSPKETRTEMEL